MELMLATTCSDTRDHGFGCAAEAAPPAATAKKRQTGRPSMELPKPLSIDARTRHGTGRAQWV